MAASSIITCLGPNKLAAWWPAGIHHIWNPACNTVERWPDYTGQCCDCTKPAGNAWLTLHPWFRPGKLCGRKVIIYLTQHIIIIMPGLRNVGILVPSLGPNKLAAIGRCTAWGWATTTALLQTAVLCYSSGSLFMILLCCMPTMSMNLSFTAVYVWKVNTKVWCSGLSGCCLTSLAMH